MKVSSHCIRQIQIYEIFPAVGVLLPHTVLHSGSCRGEQSWTAGVRCVKIYMDWKIQNDLSSWTWQKQSCGICVQGLGPDHLIVTAETGEKLPKKVCIRYLLSWQHFLSVFTFLFNDQSGMWFYVMMCLFEGWQAVLFVCVYVLFVFSAHKRAEKTNTKHCTFFFGIRTHVHNCNKRRGMPVSVHRD